ncbi:hypothetical protein [Thioclava atlantica]|uniref:Uncharacterized protein n=1 Tax=Thioclava atlantica TaxID=1317124 RepID=A0A085TXD8_9RHOB|nr:hypothetical protein [Thioclava atlantica]KFE35385.1 hypothetical protein DW2_08147 [Thioclava atlantica]
MFRLFSTLGLAALLAAPVASAQSLHESRGDAARAKSALFALSLGQHDALYAGCCKHCSSGKACGNSCISRSKTCRKGPGCACD